MRKTKIICTLGPSTDKDGVLRELVANGMNVARFNFSHGSYEEHKGRLDMLKAIRAELNKPVAALLDTKGPEIRLKEFKNGVEMLEAGQTFTLTTREVEGTKEICSITYKDLPQDVHEGGTIMLDDGLIKLAIKSVTDTDIVCEVLNSGKIKTKKGVNVPGVHLSMPYLSQRDRDDIIFGVQQGFDFIAASFVRTAQDVYDIRNLLNEYDSNIRIIAKIENREGVNNIDSILSAADAVMVARGDLGVECPLPKLPAIQKHIIQACNRASKPVIVATQMLLSMVNSPAPTRAETTDVANAVLDGADCVMLSEETAMGSFPVETVKYMRLICNEAEALLAERHKLEEPGSDSGIPEYLAYSACLLAEKARAKALVIHSLSGASAREVSSCRPPQEIYGLTPNNNAVKYLNYSWGVTPILIRNPEDEPSHLRRAENFITESSYFKKGDGAVITAGQIHGSADTPRGTNLVKIFWR